jgi:hypothetical protein
LEKHAVDLEFFGKNRSVLGTKPSEMKKTMLDARRQETEGRS